MDRTKDKNRITELQWVVPKDLQDEATRLLFGRKHKSLRIHERGFLAIIHAGQGVIRRTLYLRRIVPQQPGWVTWTSKGLMFQATYFSKAIDEISDSPPGAGLIIVHSHPWFEGTIDDYPTPSDPDLIHEKRMLFTVSRAISSGSPVAAGIVEGSGAWRVREYWWPQPKTSEDLKMAKYQVDSGSFKDATAWRLVSPENISIHTYGRSNRINTATVNSALDLWGEEGHRILGNLRVGIAGIGGVGSIVIEYLARLGVGELVLVDYDIIKDRNLNRLIGVHRNEAGQLKIKYGARIARQAATASNFKVRTFRGSVAEKEGLQQMIDADVVINAADNPLARHVLDHVAYAYLIPVIDGGTILKVRQNGSVYGKCRITKAGLGNPCLECTGSYNQAEVTMALEGFAMQGAGAYVQATSGTNVKPPHAPSVISHNGLVAALMVQRLLSTVLSFPPHGKGEQRYNVEDGDLQWMLKTECDADCLKHEWVGLGDSHPVPVCIDTAWQLMRKQELA